MYNDNLLLSNIKIGYSDSRYRLKSPEGSNFRGFVFYIDSIFSNFHTIRRRGIGGTQAEHIRNTGGIQAEVATCYYACKQVFL